VLTASTPFHVACLQSPLECLGQPEADADGVSGDGDTASIGIGQFIHLMRRNLPIIYIIEDNGVYASRRASSPPRQMWDRKLKTGVINDLPPIDTCALAIQLGATFVARSFSATRSSC